MQRRILYVGLFLISLGFGLGLATYFRSVNRAVEPKPVTALQAAEPTATLAHTIELLPPTPESLLASLTASEEKPLTDPEEIKKILTELSQKNRAYLTAQDGWLCTRVYEYQIPGNDPAQFPDVPPAQMNRFLYTPDGIRTMEECYRIEKGALYEGFTMMKDSAGREMQSTVARPDGIGINFALWEAGDPETRELALRDSKTIEYAPTPLEKTQADWAREDVDMYSIYAVARHGWLQTIQLKHFQDEPYNVFVFYLETDSPQPMQLPGIQSLVTVSSIKRFFDVRTGEQVALEARVRAEDNIWIITEYSEMRQMIYSTLPDAQQKMLDTLLQKLKEIRGEK